jgi:biopolymer transport protein ExbB/TolQ
MHKFSLIDTFTRLAELGAEWVMWLLIALACIMVVVAVERLFLFMSTKIDVGRIASRLQQALDRGDLQGSMALFIRAKGMEERVLSDALSMYKAGPNAVNEIAQASVLHERQRYERSLSFLGTVGSNSPFVGLLGTVIGVILAFTELGRNPKGGLEVVGPGISHALVATAVGLLTAIPAVVLFNWFKGMLKKRVSNSEFLCKLVIADLMRTDRPNAWERGQSSEAESSEIPIADSQAEPEAHSVVHIAPALAMEK